MRNVQKHSEPNRTGLDLTLTCQVLTDCRSIHSLTRKASYCQGTARYNGEREKNWRWKSIKLAPSSPLNSRTGGRQTRASFEGTVCLWGAIWAATRRERLVLINLTKKKKKDASDLFRFPIRIKNISRNAINCLHRSSYGVLGLMENATRGKRSLALLICMWQNLHQCVICLSPPVNGTLRREADSENAVKIRVIMTYRIRACIRGTATGLIPVLFHFCLIR